MDNVNDNLINDRLGKSKVIVEKKYGLNNPYMDVLSFASPGKVLGDYSFLADYYNGGNPYVPKQPYFAGMNGSLYKQGQNQGISKATIPTYDIYVDYGQEKKSNEVKFNVMRDDIYE